MPTKKKSAKKGAPKKKAPAGRKAPKKKSAAKRPAPKKKAPARRSAAPRRAAPRAPTAKPAGNATPAPLEAPSEYAPRSDLGASIDGYLAEQTGETRAICDALVDLVRQAVPGAEGEIKWGMPVFSANGLLC